jgi:hypothetical protein
MNCLERYREMLVAKRKPFALVDGQLFARQQRWIAPVGPAARRYSLTREQARGLQKKLGGWWVSWTEGFCAEADVARWYAVISRQFVPLEKMPAKRRYEVQRGLKNCEVRRVDAAEIARNGYETHVAAMKSYAGGQHVYVPSRTDFSARVLTDAPFADIKHHWAAYHQSRMVAFAQCWLYDRTEADYTLIKLHPECRPLYAGYALVQRMNEFYLRDQGFEYVNDGWRSILHETAVQDFLIGKFNFEKAAARLCVEFRPPFNALLKVSSSLHPILRKLDRRVAAIFELRQAAGAG